MRTVCLFLLFSFASNSVPASSSKIKIGPRSDKELTRKYKWFYDSTEFCMQLSLSNADYLYYRHKTKHVTTEQSYVRFATEDSGRNFYGNVLHQLASVASDCKFNKSEFAGFVIAFVQQAITYKKDPFNWGADYPRYGIETLVDHHGDCEDMACLLIGLSCSDCDGRCLELNGHSYYFLESTGPGYLPGYESDEMINRTHTLYNVPQTSVFNREVDFNVLSNIVKTDTLCKYPDSDGAVISRTINKSARPSPPVNTGNHWLSNAAAPKLQPKNILQLSDIHVRGIF